MKFSHCIRQGFTPPFYFLAALCVSAGITVESLIVKPLNSLSQSRSFGLLPIRATATTHVEATSEAATGKADSWERLHELLSPQQESDKTPLVTLYRDTNGWCPFCERVWLALEIKEIPYQEQLINLQDKPTWFTQMVPTGLVPAVLFHTDDLSRSKDSKNVTERTLVWESLDILKVLDQEFPDTPRLIHEEDKEYQEAREIVTKATTAGVRLLYGGRNQTVTAEEKEQKRQDFLTAVKEVDHFLGTQHTDGPFCLGESVSGVDVEMVPVLERWRYQLPITANIEVYDEAAYPNLHKWYNAMDHYTPYSNRVSGDAYSWTAVASTFLRFFSTGPNGTMSEETQEKMARADQAAEKLKSSFRDFSFYQETPAARQEAAAKLVSNHEAIVADCTNVEPKSQKEFPRASDPEAADAVLRAVALSLLTGDEPSSEGIHNKKDAALSARTVASRLCVPRDMGAPAAQILRKSLVKLADILEK